MVFLPASLKLEAKCTPKVLHPKHLVKQISLAVTFSVHACHIAPVMTAMH